MVDREGCPGKNPSLRDAQSWTPVPQETDQSLSKAEKLLKMLSSAIDREMNGPSMLKSSSKTLIQTIL